MLASRFLRAVAAQAKPVVFARTGAVQGESSEYLLLSAGIRSKMEVYLVVEIVRFWAGSQVISIYIMFAIMRTSYGRLRTPGVL